MGVKDEVIGVCNVIGREEKGKGSKRCCPEKSSTQNNVCEFLKREKRKERNLGKRSKVPCL